MNEQITRILIGIIIIAGFASVPYWFKDYSGTKLQKDSKAVSKKPDIEIYPAHQMSYDKNGDKQYSLTTAYLKHYKALKLSELTRPIIDVYKNRQLRWHVLSQTGTSHNEQETIYLSGDVRVVHSPEKSKTPAILMTEHLKVLPKAEFAETSDLVIITRGKSKTTATGMKLDMKVGKLNLLNKVDSYYEPAK